jgi:hypothetical protein
MTAVMPTAARLHPADLARPGQWRDRAGSPPEWPAGDQEETR